MEYNEIMDHKDLQVLVSEATKQIDIADLAVEASRTPYMHGRFVNILADLRKEEIEIESKMKKIIHRKWLWMHGKASDEQLQEWGYEPFQLKILKQDFDMFLEADEEFSVLLKREREIKAMIETCLEMLKSLNNRNFVIRSIVDNQKMLFGG